MGWLIAKIQDERTGDRTQIETLRTQRKLGEPSIAEAVGLLNDHGYEMGDPFKTCPADVWPLTAVVYTSPNREGSGRCGSSVYKYAVRRQEQ